MGNNSDDNLNDNYADNLWLNRNLVKLRLSWLLANNPAKIISEYSWPALAPRTTGAGTAES